MKTIYLICTLITMSIYGARAQGLPVYDNTNFITLGKQIIESAKQTANLIKTVEHLREAKERVERVSNVVKQLRAVREIGRNNEKLYRMVGDDLGEILRSPYIKAGEVERISDSFNAIIDNSLDGLDLVTQILTSDNLKMTDGERADRLARLGERSREMVQEVRQKTKRYRKIMSFRELQEKVNSRNPDF